MVAGYPTREVALEFSDIVVRLRVVRRLEDYVDAEALLRDADAPEPPYWAHIWPGSRALARLVASELTCVGRRVIELGCGVALPGIVAALRGADTTVFDGVFDALRCAAANAALNDCRLRVVQSDVRAPGLRGPFDYCLAADLTYDPHLQDAVAEFFARYLAPGGRALCAESVRTFDAGFARACERRGLSVRERHLREPDEGGEVDVRLSEVGWD